MNPLPKEIATERVTDVGIKPLHHWITSSTHYFYATAPDNAFSINNTLTVEEMSKAYLETSTEHGVNSMGKIQHGPPHSEF